MELAKKKKKIVKEQPFNPEVDTGLGRPVRSRVAVGDVNDKYSTYPSNGLTPRRLARIFRAADEGDVSEQMELFEEMEEKDTHLFSQLQTRKLAVTGLDWEVQSFSDDERDKEIAEFIDEQLKGIENLDDIFIDMLDAIGKGVSVMEIEWGLDSDLTNIIENIEYVHPKKLIWDFQTDEMKICTREFPSGTSLPENKFVVHKYKARSGHTSRAGILRVVSWMYLFKNYDVKDWVAFCEVFGMPLRLGKYSAAASDDDKKALMEAIYSLGTDAAGIIPDSTIVEFIESQKTTSVEIYRKLTKYTGEEDENFRSRIANYTEVCRLGGTDPGLILAVKALGYPNPEKIMANVLNGRVYYETDGSWILDGSRNLEAGELEDRWAEFYIVNNMSVDDEHPVSTAILKKEVRRVKEVGAKDNYLFRYGI